MKECPNCKLELPDNAHFCPRCMFQYEKEEIKAENYNGKDTRTGWFIGLLVVGILAVVIVGMRNIRKSYEEKQSETSINIQDIDEIFRTGNQIAYSSEIENDFRDMLSQNFEDVKELFGEETEAPYSEAGMDVYTFGNVTTAVNNENRIQNILIDYTVQEMNGNNGIFGIGKHSNRTEITEILGTPTQEYEKELFYHFDREFNPSLHITLSDDGTVALLEYYYIE